ncbi:MAG: DNA polymerase III subunit chi [Paracoccus sp. (in: a-proteobacteria)]|nr:DNA polymerase III subunit chi [Paracoccus sp. (in: a-proteobacteria)]
MGKVLFYHLTRSDAGALLPQLIGKSVAAGWRVELRGPDRAALEALDAALWQGDGFLPHGLAGGAHDARQPVLLRQESAPPAANAPDCVISVGGAGVVADEALRLERACILFDGRNEPALDRARDQWRALTGAGIEAEYWAESDGRWERRR